MESCIIIANNIVITVKDTLDKPNVLLNKNISNRFLGQSLGDQPILPVDSCNVTWAGSGEFGILLPLDTLCKTSDGAMAFNLKQTITM